MAPRKKGTISRKSNQNLQNTQPSKFGIQHFFERHTQNSLSQKVKQPLSPRALDPKSNLKRADNKTLNPGKEVGSDIVGYVTEKTKNELNLGVTEMLSPLENTPNDCCLLQGDNSEVSPEVCKSLSVKRFKFSPGMLIKQSQDDGGDEITWKISPVNDRLNAVSKQLPEMVRVLAESSRISSLNIQRCQLNKDSLKSPANGEKWFSSPPLKPHEKLVALSTRVGLKRVNPCHDSSICRSQGSLGDKNHSCISNSQSPFKTPPSLSYCPDKLQPDDMDRTDGKSDQLGSRQHKKALLELLDQVEGAVSVEESDCKGPATLSSKVETKKSDEISDNLGPAMASLINDIQKKVKVEVPDLPFLVLEVSEKRGSANSTSSQRAFKALRLLNEQSGEEKAVHLWDEWFHSIVAPGDTVNVIGDFDDGGKCDVNRDNNYIIVHPDVLVSGTRVAASFSCPRRAVFDERLKCGEHSVPALIGTLLHQIFQAGLVRESPTKEFLEEFAKIVLQKNLESMYACGVNEYELHRILVEAIPKMLNWIDLFRDTQDSRVASVDFGSDEGLKNVKITEVTDIEEMAWAPKYGLKGMFDASLRVRYSFGSNEAEERLMPLEFKTGKGTSGQAAMEHRAQVMLYTLLMSERYLKPIDRGILYYLHTNETQGIAIRRSNLVGMIMRRNELANDILKASITQQLPPLLQSPNMCKGCRHLNVCTIYHKAHGGSKEGSGLGDMYESLVQHLTSGHCAFLRQWERLIDLEAKVTQDSKKDIWFPSSSPFEKSASYLSSVVLDTSEDHLQKKFSNETRFIYRFIRQDLSQLDDDANNGDSSSSRSPRKDDINCALKSGDYVVLTTESRRLMVASGIIVEISRSHVTVTFSKRLRLPASSPASVAQDLQREVWCIYKDESVSLFAIMRFNLVQLFLQSEHSFNLRRMIADLEAPRFDSGSLYSQDPAISYIWSEKNLNNDQRRAIIKILNAKDYALILGMPGTGKTSTMVHAVKALLMRGASILLTSYTNSAVDNLLIKLKAQGIDFVRIGRNDAVHEEVRGHCFSEMDIQRVDEIKARLDQIKVVAVTCLGITSPLLVNKRFDVCIMDEAGQTTLPVSLGPLMYASKFVLVGDHYQLPPLVQSTEALESDLNHVLVMGVSLFCRLSEAHPQAISALRSQYRMCAGIMELSNALIYGNRLSCGSLEVKNSKLKFTSSRCSLPWLEEVLDPNRPVIFVNTDMLPALESKDGKTINNPLEAKIVAQITEELVSKGIKVEDIGVITPYNSQAHLIRLVVSTSVEIHTIDKYQGRDKDCILISFVRSSESPKNFILSLLGDWRRINVALTRAKRKMIMVGSCKTLSKVPLLKLLIQKVEEQSGILNLSQKDINQRELKSCSNARLN